jgi:hypothetical protein
VHGQRPCQNTTPHLIPCLPTSPPTISSLFLSPLLPIPNPTLTPSPFKSPPFFLLPMQDGQREPSHTHYSTHDALVISFTLTRAQGGGRYESVGSKSPSRVQQYAHSSPSRVEHYALAPSRVQQYTLTKRADVFNAGVITARRTSSYGGNGDSPTKGGGGGGGARPPYSASVCVTSVQFFFLCLLLQTPVDSCAREGEEDSGGHVVC